MRYAFLSIFVLLAACSARVLPIEPTILSANEKQIILERTPYAQEVPVYTAASRHCSSYGKSSVFAGKDGNYKYIFNCS